MDARRRQSRQLLPPDTWHDMVVDVVAIVFDCAALPALEFDVLNPILCGLRNRDALACRDVRTLTDIDLDASVILVRILFALELWMHRSPAWST